MKKANITANEDEHLVILACRLHVQADEDAKRRVSKFRRRKTKPRQMMKGRFKLYANYFAYLPTFPLKNFRRPFGMNKELFLQLVLGENDSYFKLKKDRTEMTGFLLTSMVAPTNARATSEIFYNYIFL